MLPSVDLLSILLSNTNLKSKKEINQKFAQTIKANMTSMEVFLTMCNLYIKSCLSLPSKTYLKNFETSSKHC